MIYNEIDINSMVLIYQVRCVVLENGRWIAREFCDRSSEAKFNKGSSAENKGGGGFEQFKGIGRQHCDAERK